MDPSLTDRKVTLEMSDVPARVVLMTICHRIGCNWELLGEPEAGVLKVEASGE